MDPGTPVIDIVAEAGDWPGEAELIQLAEAAVAAALAALATADAPNPPLTTRTSSPPWGEAESAQSAEPGKGSGSHSYGPTSDRRDPSPQSGGRLRGMHEGAELSIVFTDDAAIRKLNAQYRGVDKSTNVLSFPQGSGPLLGDIVLAFETVRDEAALAGKPIRAHMAHLIIHGFLHLLGHDHEADDEAEAMEAVERQALEKIGIADPYAPARDR